MQLTQLQLTAGDTRRFEIKYDSVLAFGDKLASVSVISSSGTSTAQNASLDVADVRAFFFVTAGPAQEMFTVTIQVKTTFGETINDTMVFVVNPVTVINSTAPAAANYILAGPTGPIGPQGPTGIGGATGFNGPTGATGYLGAVSMLSNIAYVGTSIAAGSLTNGGTGYGTSGPIGAFKTLVAGSGYVPGIYSNVPITGGSGSGATATIVVKNDGTVFSATISASGTGYSVTDTGLSASNTNLGGSGSGFSVAVSTIIYTGVPLTGGHGTGAQATVQVGNSSGVVSSVGLSALGTGFVVNDQLSAGNTNLGGSGSGLIWTVTSVGETLGPNDTWLWMPGNVTSGIMAGTVPDGNIGYFNIYIGSDSVDAQSKTITALSVELAPSSTSRTGNRSAIQGYCVPTGPDSASSTTHNNVGVLGLCSTSHNLGGTTGAYTNYKGGLFGMNSNVFTAAGATGLAGVYGLESDVTLVVGSSASRKTALNLVKGSLDAVRADYEDYCILIADQPGATATWKVGLSFGAAAAQWPFGTDSTLIQATPRSIGASQTPIAMFGIDFSQITFTVGGAPILAPLITPSTSGATGTQGSVTWDASYIYVCTATNTWKRATLNTF